MFQLIVYALELTLNSFLATYNTNILYVFSASIAYILKIALV
jgi:hypothetical protein